MDEIIKHYSEVIETIIANDTVGDFTWVGVLSSFAMEAVDKGYLFPARPTV